MSTLIDGFSDAEIVKAISQAQPVNYTYVAAITLMAYDSLILFSRETRYIYRNSTSHQVDLHPRQTDRMVDVHTRLCYIFDTARGTYTLKLCRARQWISGFFFEVGYTAIIKTLLVLRLRAFYQNDKWVTIILCLTTAIELLSTTYAYIMTGLNIHWYLRVPSPIPGCPLRAGNKMSYFRSPTVAWATRLASNSLELLLLLFGLQRTLSTSNEHFHKGWQRMKQLAPVLYVFYRDGTMFYLPYTLNYKNIKYKTIFVEYPELEKVFKDAGIPPHNDRSAGPRYTCPAITDNTRGIGLSDSYMIAEYLDKAYPDSAKVIPPGTESLQAAFYAQFTRMATPFLPLFQSRVPAILNKPSADHYFRTRSEKFGKPLNEVEPVGEELVQVWAATKANFEEVDIWLKKSPGQFFMDDRPIFADFVVAARLQGLRTVLGENSEEWRNIERWHDGRWKVLLKDLEQYATESD
ncbi:hypothetical protein D9756_009606 [Leucocoprinus leucothites]|uniref:GST N-terminal domain-containing protein n=1 Tax=Leucocoprinus leucothites TaxID=201217 RepID=A0A8H5CWT4_9AGAR|nr:hypothetical protein D9756_009606 [Leucoagaricus leucothites]